MLVRVAHLVFAAVLVLAACVPARSPQPSFGLGWSLVSVSSSGGAEPSGIRLLGANEITLLFRLVVHGTGAHGCGSPRFLGFEPNAETLVARIERSRTDDVCLVTTDAVFDVLLERKAIPTDVTRLELTEACGESRGCAGHPVLLDF